ncbi:hypothetical protein D3C75_1062410 [compost metagenome]
MDKQMIANDLREEIAFWRMMEDDALLRGGKGDWENAKFSSQQRRAATRKLSELLDGKGREEYRREYLQALTYEKQPTGLGASRLSVAL